MLFVWDFVRSVFFTIVQWTCLTMKILPMKMRISIFIYYNKFSRWFVKQSSEYIFYILTYLRSDYHMKLSLVEGCQSESGKFRLIPDEATVVGAISELLTRSSLNESFTMKRHRLLRQTTHSTASRSSTKTPFHNRPWTKKLRCNFSTFVWLTENVLIRNKPHSSLVKW